VPSWKAVAMAILKNDLQFISLGFQPRSSAIYDALKREERDENTMQKRLFR
jgi:predicted phosphoadenosine phosphosulfate sulfurtransferase